jgi:Na+-driven multidrug efflux pump
LSIMLTTDENLIALSVKGMRIALSAAPVVGFQMVVSNFFQSIGQAPKAVFLSSTRQLLFLVPLLLILPNFFGTTGVWLSMPISDVLAAILAAVLLFRDKTLKIKQS